MMVRILLLLMVVVLGACTPVIAPSQLPDDCRAEFTASELIARSWLKQPQVWRLRQSALLEIGRRKMPLEGFLQIDPQRQEARLLAMNEVGLVLFDLQVTAAAETLHRAVPQLQKIEGFSRGVARSLRQIFMTPQPRMTDQMTNRGNSQILWRVSGTDRLDFTFDCFGDLRQTRQQSERDDWRVSYDDYQLFDDFNIPAKIVMNDYRHSVTLSLWTREVKQEP